MRYWWSAGAGARRWVHTLDEAARVVGMHPERLRHYCRLGVFGPALAHDDREPQFDDDRLYELRRFEHFRQRLGVNPDALRLLCDL
ncbi:MAG: MerR family transcriptional regulator [Candidatus Synoicihabitans palmerolidicus]|nr:MerR family transcriptional regulator [Candidatus Synoicihabitans palmerolidicus]